MELIPSPYDPEARYGTKRETNWVGYKVHITETCDLDAPQLITNVETTPATTSDFVMLPTIHEHLADRNLEPSEHLVDSGYMTAEHVVTSQGARIDLLGPVTVDRSWQAKAGQGFDAACFQIDWERQRVTCPQGNQSTRWKPWRDTRGKAIIQVAFAEQECLACPVRTQCTHSPTRPREVSFRPQAEYEALQRARARQTTEEFKVQYAKRAGIEGTLAQGLARCDLRQARYIGMAKTALQHILTAVALNLVRIIAWWRETLRATTRQSHFAALAPAG
jgi:transposase